MRTCLKVAAMAALCLMVAACGEESEGGGQQANARQKPFAVPVGTVVLSAESVSLIEKMPGRTVALRQVGIRPQVDGIINERNFTEGALVEAGQQLYLIDQDAYLAHVDAAQAELSRRRAILDQATKTHTRYDSLIQSQAVSQQTYDDAVSAEAQAKASVAAARADLEQSRIALEHTTVKAPISGRISASDYSEGALVTANQTAKLTTITQLDPIYVDFMPAGGRLLKMKEAVKNGRIKGAEQGNIEVSLIIGATGVEYPYKGILQFSDVTVNETTGTVRLRTVFPNPEGTLLPGMFVRGQVRRDYIEDAFLVPQRAVMRRPDGSAHVYVVADDKVVSKDVLIEQSQGQDWLVSAGVENGDHLIVDGLQRVGPGAIVAPQLVETAKNVE